MSEDAEGWRPIPAWHGIPRGYQGSTRGRVRSVPRTLRDGRRASGQVLTPWLDKDGYEVVRLGRRNVRVNVAVQLAFAGPPEVRHLDGLRGNNRPENLAWGSRVDNEQDKREARKQDGRGFVPPRTAGTSETAELR